MRRTILFIFILFCSTIHTSGQLRNVEKKDTSESKQISGKVIGIIDGDTYDILIDGDQTLRIRMEGIDAPEKGMPFYKVAKKYLSDLCFDKKIILQRTGNDNHNRILAFSYLENGTELGQEMLKASLAWHFKKYNSDATLALLETKAREAKIGIWQHENPMTPWVNRELHQNGISTKDSFEILDGQQ